MGLDFFISWGRKRRIENSVRTNSRAPCPRCGKRLKLRLMPDWGDCLWCGHCGYPIGKAALVEAGVDARFARRILVWGALVFNLGVDLAPGRYYARCKELGRQFRELLPKLRRRFAVKVEWVQAPIVNRWSRKRTRRWQLWKRKLQRSFDKGMETGRSDGDPAAGRSLPTESEREQFRQGFELGKAFFGVRPVKRARPDSRSSARRRSSRRGGRE
jgi:ribosomal protein S27AE